MYDSLKFSKSSRPVPRDDSLQVLQRHSTTSPTIDRGGRLWCAVRDITFLGNWQFGRAQKSGHCPWRKSPRNLRHVLTLRTPQKADVVRRSAIMRSKDIVVCNATVPSVLRLGQTVAQNLVKATFNTDRTIAWSSVSW